MLWSCVLSNSALFAPFQTPPSIGADITWPSTWLCGVLGRGNPATGFRYHSSSPRSRSPCASNSNVVSTEHVGCPEASTVVHLCEARPSSIRVWVVIALIRSIVRLLASRRRGLTARKASTTEVVSLESRSDLVVSMAGARLPVCYGLGNLCSPIYRSKVALMDILVLRLMLPVQSLTSSLHFTLSTTPCQSSNLT